MSSNNAMAAKARSMFGKRFREEDYNILLSQSSVGNIAYALKHETAYAAILDGINEKAVHRGQLEALMRMQLFATLKKLMLYTDKTDEYFIYLVVMDTEVDMIRRCIKYLISHDEDDRYSLIQRMPVYIEKYFTFDIEALARVKSYEELLAVLSKSPYKEALEVYAGQTLADDDLAAIDHGLYATEYRCELEVIKRRGGQAKEILREIALSQVELANLTIIYRLKENFNIAPERIKALIAPYYVRFSQREIIRLINTAAPAEIIAALRRKYGQYIQDTPFTYIEHYMDMIRYKMFMHAIRFDTHPDVALMAYIGLLKLQISNIVTIIEGVHYNVSPDRIRTLLVC